MATKHSVAVDLRWLEVGRRALALLNGDRGITERYAAILVDELGELDSEDLVRVGPRSDPRWYLA